MMVRIDDPAPDFTLPDETGRPFRLSAQDGRRLLLVFYQLCDYRDGIEQFGELGVAVVAISRDDADSHRRFRDKYELPFVLLTDPDMKVAGQYGCRGLIGMKRGVFLIDEKQTVRYAHIEQLALFRRSRDELIEVIRQLA